MSDYESKAKTKQFGGTSRASVKIKDSFYTFEASTVRDFPENIDMESIDMAQEWKILYNELNDEVDRQIIEIEESYKKQ